MRERARPGAPARLALGLLLLLGAAAASASAAAAASMTGFELRVARSSRGVTMVAGMDNRFTVNGVTVFDVATGVNASTCAGEAARAGFTYYAFTNGRCFGARDLVEAAIDPVAERLVPNMASLFDVDFGLVERACDAADSNYYCSLRPASNSTSANALYVVFVRLCAGAQRNCGGVCAPPSRLGCCPITETAQLSSLPGTPYLCQASCPVGQVRFLHPVDGFSCVHEDELCSGNSFDEGMQCCVNPDTGCCVSGRKYRAGARCVAECPAGTIGYSNLVCDSPACRADSVYTRWDFDLSACVEGAHGCTPQQVWSPARGACWASCAPSEERSGRECVAVRDSPGPSPSPSPWQGPGGGDGGSNSAATARAPRPMPLALVLALLAAVASHRRPGSPGADGLGLGSAALLLLSLLLVAAAPSPASAGAAGARVDSPVGYVSLMSADSPALPLECVGNGIPYSAPVDEATCQALAMARGHNYWTNARGGTCCTSRTLFAGNYVDLAGYRALVNRTECVSYTFRNATGSCADFAITQAGSLVPTVYPCAIACKIALEYRDRLADGGALLVKNLFTEVYARVHRACPTSSVNCEGTCETVGAASTTSVCPCCSKQAAFQDDPNDPATLRCVPAAGGCGNAYRAVVDESTGCNVCVDVETFCARQAGGWSYSPALRDCINAQGCPLERPVRFLGECIRAGECPYGYSYSQALGTCVLSARLACTSAVGNWSDAKSCCVGANGCCAGMYRLPPPPTSTGECRFDCPASMVRDAASGECWTASRAYCEAEPSAREWVPSDGLCVSKTRRDYCYFRSTPTSDPVVTPCSQVNVVAPLGARPRFSRSAFVRPFRDGA